MKLSGKNILITRSADANPELRLLLESRGASVICFPSIEIVPPDSWEKCDAAIWRLAEYDSVCFTSGNAVKKFIERLRLLRPQAVDTLATRNIFAIGEKTKSALESSGFSVIASPKHASAAELANMLQSHQISGVKILIPKSNIAREELPEQLRKMGAVVDEVTVYCTVIPKIENPEQTKKMLREKKIDIAAFFSPSGITNFTEMFGMELLENTTIAVIGPTTAETAAQLGFKSIIVAGEAANMGLVETIEKFIRE